MNVRYYLLILVILSCSVSKEIIKDENKQNSFEGYITYKMSTVKPDMISEEDWQIKLKELSGEQGYYQFKNYYRPNQFASEVNTGLSIGKQVYNPKDSLHYAWELESDSAITEDNFAESMIKIKNIVDLDTTATINNISCKAIKVNMTFGHTIIWYNSSLFNFDGEEYRGSLFGKEIINRIKTLPVKVEVPGMLDIELIEYKREAINDNLFIIPEFKNIQKKPTF